MTKREVFKELYERAAALSDFKDALSLVRESSDTLGLIEEPFSPLSSLIDAGTKLRALFGGDELEWMARFDAADDDNHTKEKKVVLPEWEELEAAYAFRAGLAKSDSRVVLRFAAALLREIAKREEKAESTT